MPWPTDPERRALALANHRAAQQRRRARQEDREHAREVALRQYADPEQRRKMSEIKRRQYQERPDIAIRISRSMGGEWCAARAAARKRVAARNQRAFLIKQRAMLVSRNGTSQSQA